MERRWGLYVRRTSRASPSQTPRAQSCSRGSFRQVAPLLGPAATLGIRAAVCDRWGPVALAGPDPVAAAVRRPPSAPPDHWLGALARLRRGGRLGGSSGRAAGRRLRRSRGLLAWHGSRVRKHRRRTNTVARELQAEPFQKSSSGRYRAPGKETPQCLRLLNQ
jgi:hypothetical protein